MYVAYILRNSLTNRHYIGNIGNYERRILEHNRGQAKSTRQKGIWTLIYEEKFENSIETKRRERQIKSYKGGNAFKKFITRG